MPLARVPGQVCTPSLTMSMVGEGVCILILVAPRRERVMAVKETIGVVIDYVNPIGVAVIWLTDGDVRRGDQVRIAGRTTELSQAVESLEIDHRPVEGALRGSEVAMKIADPVRRHDQVFRVRDR
jgi:hypothetical protein